MKCSRCGHQSLAMKTLRPRSGGVSFLLCDPCWEPLATSVWIVAGHLPAHGKCRECLGWFSLRELEYMQPGGKWDAPSGICSGCFMYEVWEDWDY